MTPGYSLKIYCQEFSKINSFILIFQRALLIKNKQPFHAFLNRNSLFINITLFNNDTHARYYAGGSHVFFLMLLGTE